MGILRRFIRNTIAQVKRINKKYAKPQIKMTPWVKFSLLCLRLYLILLIALLIVKFILELRGTK